MSSAVILAAGDFPRKPYPLYLLQSADVIVCCDSAFATFLRHRPRLFGEGTVRLPEAIVGDMDSLPKKLQARYADLIHRDPGQEDNDLTKAVRYLLKRHPELDQIHILGATGRRADHTIGNLSLLMEYPRLFGEALPPIDIVSDHGTAFAVTDTIELHVGEGRRISLFSPDGSLKIKSEGLVWPTDSVVFDNWWKATLNRSNAPIVRLVFSHPSRALVILD